MKMCRPKDYDDGLDADGYPLPYDGPIPYKHGDESAAGDFKPIKLIDATITAIDRCMAALDIGANCESPIEVLMGAALLTFFDRAGHPLMICKSVDLQNPPRGLLLVPQFAWSYYRSDWAVINPAHHGAFLIECDGKDFHSSREQKAHDLRKDTAALERGFLTIRFTGSQIHRDADGCAQKIFDAVLGS